MTTDPLRWARYAELASSPGLVRTAYNAWMSHIPTLSQLLAFRPPPARLLSIGCSVGMVDILFAGHGYQVTSIDTDETALQIAADNARKVGVQLDLRLGDAFDLSDYHGRYDVAFSAGLVEHWQGERTVELVREHARCAPIVQVEVPTKHTRHIAGVPEVLADMRLYTRRQFVDRVREADLKVDRVYATGSVPTFTRRAIEAALPPILFRRLQLAFGYSMGVGVVARRRS